MSGLSRIKSVISKRPSTEYIDEKMVLVNKSYAQNDELMMNKLSQIEDLRVILKKIRSSTNDSLSSGQLFNEKLVRFAQELNEMSNYLKSSSNDENINIVVKLLSVVSDISTVFVEGHSDIQNDLENGVAPVILDFEKEIIKNARDKTVEVSKAYGLFQQNLASLNLLLGKRQNFREDNDVPSPIHSPLKGKRSMESITSFTNSDTSSPKSPDTPSPTSSKFIGTKNRLSAFGSKTTKVASDLFNRDPVAEAKKQYSARVALDEQTVILEKKADEAWDSYEKLNFALESRQIPQALLSHIRKMKAFFKNGFEKLEEMFPDDEIKATQLSLLKQSEQTLTKPKSSRVYDSVRSVCSSERQNGIQQKDVQKRRSMFGLDFSDLGNIIPGTPVSPFSSASLDISNVSSSPSISVGKNSPSSASNGTGVNPSRPVSPLSKMTNNLVSERIGLFQTQSGLPPQKSSNRLNIEPKMTEVKPIIPCRPADGNSSDHTLKFIPSRPLPPISTVSKDNSITLKFVPPPPTKSTKFIEPQSSNSKAVKFGPPPPPLKLTTMIVPQNNSTSTSTKPRGIPPPRPPVPPPIKHISTGVTAVNTVVSNHIVDNSGLENTNVLESLNVRNNLSVPLSDRKFIFSDIPEQKIIVDKTIPRILSSSESAEVKEMLDCYDGDPLCMDTWKSLKNEEKLLVRLFSDVNFTFFRIILTDDSPSDYSVSSLPNLPDLSSQSVLSLIRYATTCAKLLDSCGILTKFLLGVVSKDNYRFFKSNMYTDSLSGITIRPIPKSIEELKDSGAQNVDYLTDLIMKQCFILQGRFYLQKTIGQLGKDIWEFYLNNSVNVENDYLNDSNKMMELVKGFMTNVCQKKDLILRSMRLFFGQAAKDISSKLEVSSLTDEDDLENIVLVVLFFRSFLLPALQNPIEWGIEMPWDAKSRRFKFYTCTFRDPSTNDLETPFSCKLAVYEKVKKVMDNVIDIVSSVVGFYCGVVFEPTQNDNLSISLISTALMSSLEPLLCSLFRFPVISNTQLASTTKMSNDPTTAIGVTILRQDIEILQEMHIFCRAGRIIKWISFLTHSDVKVFDKNSELCLLELAQQLKSHDLIDVQLNAEFQIIDGTDSSCDDTSDDEEGMTVTQKATAKFGNFAKGMLKKALS